MCFAAAGLYVVAPLVTVPAVADSVERVNSTYKWVQTGRVTLNGETARKVVHDVTDLSPQRGARSVNSRHEHGVVLG
jgi:hypothetical protein